MNNAPFLLCPVYKDYIWGGDRLKKEFNKDTEISPLAESWECSVHPDGESMIISGEFRGKTLNNVLDDNPEFLGSHPDKSFGFPLLIKLIDANEKLSLQVHPNDEYAFEYENGEHGKTEMWYILDAKPDSKLIYGFAHNTEEETVKNAIANGTLQKHLNEIPVEKDDVFMVNAGTVHAIGSGIILAEIQESSNLTYRIFDYDRTDKNGQKRKLHIDKALKVMDYTKSSFPRQPLRVLKYRRGAATELLARCRYFEVSRMLINADGVDVLNVPYEADSFSFRVLLCIDGQGRMTYGSEHIDFRKGSCVFVPANSVKIEITGKANFLDVRA